MDNNNNHSNIVVKSNALINAIHRMGLQEMRFLAYAISLIDRNTICPPGQPLDLEVDVLGFRDAFDIEGHFAYSLIKSLSDKLKKHVIEFITEDGKYEVAVSIIQKRKYHLQEGRLWIRFDEDLVPHLLKLKKHFTQYRIKDVYQFQRPTSWRVYELIRQYKEIGKRTFELDELKWKLGVVNKYPRFADFKKRVLEPAIVEINSTSDIKVQYEQKKRGRRIVGLTFYIIENENTKSRQEKIRNTIEKEFGDSPTLAPELAKILREEYRVSPKQAKQIANLAAGREQEIQTRLPKLKERWRRLPEKQDNGKPKTNLGGYVFKALKAELTNPKQKTLT